MLIFFGLVNDGDLFAVRGSGQPASRNGIEAAQNFSLLVCIRDIVKSCMYICGYTAREV